MIVKRNKSYSISDRTKAGLKGLGYGVGGAFALGTGMGIIGGEGLKNKLLMSIATTLLALPGSMWAGYKSGVAKYDLDNKSVSTPNWKLIEEKQKAKEENYIKTLMKKLDIKFPEIKGMVNIYKETNSFIPNWGDGDEYPIFDLIFNSDYKEQKPNFIPILTTSHQDIDLGINPERGWWCLELSPEKKIPNLKQYLLNYYKSALKDWIKWQKTDEFGFGDYKEYSTVIWYLKDIIKSINKNLN